MKVEVIETAGATLAEINKYWDKYQELGAVVPELILRDPSESRADIKQAGTRSNGEWTVEIKRALVTGNHDDVQFSDLSFHYLFGVSIMDNAGGDDAYAKLRPASSPRGGAGVGWCHGTCP